MTKRKYFMCLCLLLVGLFLPFTVKAKEKVTVYLFRGETCPHCEEALEFFQKLISQNEFQEKVIIRHLEIWNSETNYDIANEAAEKLGKEPINGSVPFIIIGDKTWTGYSSKSDEDIKNAINDAYENQKEDKVKDIVGESGEVLEPAKSEAVTTFIILGVIVGIIGATVYFARSGEEEEETEPNKKEEKEEQEIEKEPKKASTTTKKSNNKKSNTKKSSKKSNK